MVPCCRESVVCSTSSLVNVGMMELLVVVAVASAAPLVGSDAPRVGEEAVSLSFLRRVMVYSVFCGVTDDDTEDVVDVLSVGRQAV